MEVTAEILEGAIAFSIEKHKGQRRKGNGHPYILHPMEVLVILLSIKESKNTLLLATAAILHDVVEDCEVTIEEIAKEFGTQVAALVDELTSDPTQIKLLGKTEYLKHKMEKMSSYGLCVKLVDRLVNIKDMKSMSQTFILKQISSTEEIFLHLEKNRKLTKTHKRLIKMIKKEIKKYVII